MSRADTRNRIVDAAGPVFAEKGYQAATVREICDQAGMNVASVNYYFGDKENLYAEVIRRIRPPRIAESLQDAWTDETAPAEKLCDFIRAMVSELSGRELFPWFHDLIRREISDPTPIGGKLLQKQFEANFAMLQGILDEIVPADTPMHKRHKIAFSVVGQCVHFHISSQIASMVIGEEEYKAHFGPEDIAEHICQMCLASLGLAPPIVEPRPEAVGRSNSTATQAVPTDTSQPEGA